MCLYCCVCVFYNIYFVQRGSCLFSACLHFVLLHVIIVVAAAVSLQRHRQTCVAGCLALSLPFSLSLCVYVRVICSTVVCSLCNLGTHLAAAEATAPCATKRAQFLHLLQISNGFFYLPFLLYLCLSSSPFFSLIFHVFAQGIRYVCVYVSLRFGRGLFDCGCIHMH